MSDPDPRAAKPATPHTASVNAAFAASLRLEDDWERATQGLIAQHESGEIEGPLGLSWNTNDWNFLREQEDPPSRSTRACGVTVATMRSTAYLRSPRTSGSARLRHLQYHLHQGG